MPRTSCVFCEIVSGSTSAAVVFEDEVSIAFLDVRPVFPGHVLLAPRAHVETLPELPAELLKPLFGNAQLLCRAVETALEAQGSFVAINNRVSQSVRHLHVHIVPRRPKDGLRGFFWPRTKYTDDTHLGDTQNAIRRAVAELKP